MLISHAYWSDRAVRLEQPPILPLQTTTAPSLTTHLDLIHPSPQLPTTKSTRDLRIPPTQNLPTASYPLTPRHHPLHSSFPNPSPHALHNPISSPSPPPPYPSQHKKKSRPMSTTSKPRALSNPIQNLLVKGHVYSICAAIWGFWFRFTFP
ncbi:hypothetical protein BO82DRAFT_71882 [Aspergillus uvarum CBS 121591]|uniref:Uncharacterized protein n=1 Tax=Aspergillus uvarum CBS 121591 TaxID=1448315 RepID=A0A319CE38_9EURO|nr:hypothetical protein BO82DRAFT_71882 [Aspergillus uvarum CBS 121591]PYH81991.1 hypothetical protein BO82DRAFT_71882 [Aspergillus uvarum CBS 121591]